MPERQGTGSVTFQAGVVAAGHLVLQIACIGPGKVTVLQQTVSPCAGSGVITVVMSWTPGPLKVRLHADQRTRWSIYIGAQH